MQGEGAFVDFGMAEGAIGKRCIYLRLSQTIASRQATAGSE